MKKIILSLALFISSYSFAAPTIEIGVLLDSSGSMQGLINKTRNTLWSVINNLDGVTKNNQPAQIKIGLYSYGNSLHPEAQNQIVLISELTEDLDTLSEEFYKLTANGSNEYAGEVIQQAINNLNWNQEDGFKALFLAGNETVHQGTVNVLSSAIKAVENNIFLNTIYAYDGDFTPAPIPNGPRHPSLPFPGEEGSSIKQGWQDLANAGNGSFAHISNNENLPPIETIYDDKIIELDSKLNQTYVPYGMNGKRYYDRMIEIDGRISEGSRDSFVGRGRYKAGGHYKVESWDLVEAYFNGKVKIEDLNHKFLPQEIQGLSKVEIIAFLTKKLEQRDGIKEQIKQLYKLREEFIAKERKKLGHVTITDVITNALKNQLKEKGFSIN